MSAALDRCTALLGDPNCRAFLEVIADGESNHTDDAYRLANVGGVFHAYPITHPWYGRTTTEVGHSTAFGKFQFLGSSAREACEALGLDGSKDFGPVTQQLCALWTIDVKRHALAEVMAGNVLAAAAKLDDEWVALKTMAPERVKRVFLAYGGHLAAAQIDAGAPIGAPDTSYPSPQPKGAQMPALALLQLFGPILAGLVPQIANILKPESEVAKRNVGLAELILNTINTAAAQPTLQGSIEAMQSDKAVQAKVQQAIVTAPEIIESLSLTEFGGGPAAVREHELAMTDSRPWWTFLANASFWIALFLTPLLYLTVYKVLWTEGASEQLQTVVVTAILSGLLGSLTGFFFGSAYTATRTTRTPQATASPT